MGDLPAPDRQPPHFAHCTVPLLVAALNVTLAPPFSCREGAALGSARERFTRFHRDWPGRKEREGVVGLVLTDPFCRLPTYTSERTTIPLPANKTTVRAVLHCYDDNMLGRRSRPSAAPLQLA